MSGKTLGTILLAVWLVLFLDMTLRWFPDPHSGTNFIPFKTIRHDLNKGGRDFWINFCGNVVYFIPAGALLPWVRSRPTSALRVALCALAVSASVETAQYVSGRRVADIDDVILNVSGALLGFAAGRPRQDAGPVKPPP